MSTTHTRRHASRPYTVTTSTGRRTRCATERSACAALGRMLDQPGVTGSIERYGETVLTAVGTSLGWTRTTP